MESPPLHPPPHTHTHLPGAAHELQLPEARLYVEHGEELVLAHMVAQVADEEGVAGGLVALVPEGGVGGGRVLLGPCS